MRHLSLVRSRPSEVPEPVGQPVAHVPVRLLLAASGRCSCDDCCRAAVLRSVPVRPARGTERRTVRNLHLLG